jgi:hypothetical protein
MDLQHWLAARAIATRLAGPSLSSNSNLRFSTTQHTDLSFLSKNNINFASKIVAIAGNVNSVGKVKIDIVRYPAVI